MNSDLQQIFGWLINRTMWEKQCQQPAMTGNSIHTTYKHGEIEDGL